MQTEEFASQNAGSTDGRSRRSGFALLGILGAMLVVALLAAGLLTLFNSQLLQTSESALASRAFQAAETGLSLGKAYISTNLFWYTNALPRTIVGTNGQSIFSIVITTNSAGMARITSTGDQDPTEWTSIWEDLAGNYIGSGGRGRLVQGMVVYRDNVTAPTNRSRWRAYTRFKDVSDEQMALTNTAAPQWQRVVASPKTNEFLLVGQDSSGWICGQVCTGNTWFARTNLNAVAVVAANRICRGFDVAYENLSGRGMVVYSTNGVNPQYRIWNGTNWSAQVSITNIAANNVIRWVRLVSEPNANEIMLLCRWQNTTNLSCALVWNGTTWGNRQMLEGSATTTEINYETMDAAYSTNNMALVVYIGPATALRRPKYRTWNGAAWSAEGLIAQLPDNNQPRWIRVEFNPNGTNAFAAIMDRNSQLSGMHWTGAAWSGVWLLSSIALNTGVYRDFDIAWGEQTNALMAVYALSGQTYRTYMFQPQGAAAVYGTTPNVASLGQWIVLRTNPFADEFVYMGLDDANDVGIQRWDGAAWSVVAEMETNSAVTYCSIDMAFRNDTNAIPVP